MSSVMVRFCLFVSLSVSAITVRAEIGRSEHTSVIERGAGVHSPSVKAQFIRRCVASGVSEAFCSQITSPNSKEQNNFIKVYGKNTPFILMPPTDKWDLGIQYLKIAESLNEYGKVCEIRNWYRPSKYNKVVKGARQSRHLDASAIDIEFCSPEEKAKALQAVLAMRQQHAVPAGVGVYGEGGLVIHIDNNARLYGPGIDAENAKVSKNTQFASIANPLNQSYRNGVMIREAALNTDFLQNIFSFFLL